MKRVTVGELEGLMQYTNEIKFSNAAVMFKGVYINPILNEGTPFCLTRTLSELDPKEYSQLMDLTLPNGHKVFEVFAKIRECRKGDKMFWELPSDEKLNHIAVNEIHVHCKHYGGTSNYCHKLHEIIKTPCRCGFFEKK